MKHLLKIAIGAVLLLSCRGGQQANNKVHEASHKNLDLLRASISSFIGNKKADIGIAVLNLENGDTLSFNGHKGYALMSVAKFPQALLLLHLIDEGKIDISKPLHFSTEDLKQRTGSSIRKDHPEPTFDLSISEALSYAMGQSDNITANKIFEIEGGPKAVDTYVHSKGIKDIGIFTDFAHMGTDSLHKNWASPLAMAELLSKFYKRELLKDNTQKLLWRKMVESTSGANRMKGQLPSGTIVAHKTGTSGTDSTGKITLATNDVGIVQLPNGQHFAIAVFVGDSHESDTENANIIATVSKMVWDYFTGG